MSTNANAAAWLLDRHVQAGSGERLALVEESSQVTYAELTARASAAGMGLRAQGIDRGDRVIISMPDGIDAVACILGAMRSGAVPVPISPLLTADEQLGIARDCNAAGVILDDTVRELRPELGTWRPDRTWVAGELAAGDTALGDLGEPEPVVPDEVALIQYTSGSTGKPKGVVHLHRGLLAAPGCFGARLALTPEDRVLSTAKLSFGYGFGNSVLFPLAAGASAVLHPGSAEIHAIGYLVDTYRPQVFCSVPAFYAGVLRLPDPAARFDLSGVRLLLSAGEHLTEALAQRWVDEFGTYIMNGLGSTECLHIFLATEPGRSQLGTSGRPVPGCEVKAVDDAGRTLPAGEPGRLAVRSPMSALRYWDNEDVSNRTFVDGWVYTGDVVVELDAAGEWQHLGRGDDMINAGGIRMAPQEIESQVLGHPAVAECAVVGRRTGEYGLEQIVAFVVPRDEGASHAEIEQAVRRYLRETLAPAKRPAEIVVLEALPRTSTGKLARFRLREHVVLDRA